MDSRNAPANERALRNIRVIIEFGLHRSDLQVRTDRDTFARQTRGHHREIDMTQTITALFDTFDEAKIAVRDLEAAGVPHAEVSVVANNVHGEHDHMAANSTEAAKDAGKGAGVGATVGGLGGLLTGLGIMAIPGVGPVVAAGWLVATAVGAVTGAVVGGAAGGVVGALTTAGVSNDDANLYAEGVRRGGTLVTARVDDALAPAARAALSHERAVNLAARGASYRQDGWTAFDETSPTYTADQIAAERARYAGGII
jgi:hypothetical protein